MNMWKKLANFILRYRLLWLIFIFSLTLFFGINAFKIKLSYQLVQFLPNSHPTMVTHNRFLDTYGQDGKNVYLGVEDSNLFQLDHFNTWNALSDSIADLDGVKSVFSLRSIFDLTKNDSLEQFEIRPLFSTPISSQAQLDSLKQRLDELAFYDGLIFNKETGGYVTIITFDDDCLNSKGMYKLVSQIEVLSNKIFEIPTGVDVHISGMPYIRASITNMLKSEVTFFTLLSILVSAIILFLFFKSFKMVWPILVIVFVSVVIMFGMMGCFGFKITVFTTILPPLLIIICVENSIFLVNKYMTEYHRCQDQMVALKSAISRIGVANFLTNATTAASFVSFAITKNEILTEFGILSSVNIFLAYLLTLFMIPILFSFQKPPRKDDFVHRENGIIKLFIGKVFEIVMHRRSWIYIISFVLIVFGVIGTAQLRTAGSLVDDLSENSSMYQDLNFFEKHLKGVMPLEITIDTKKIKGIVSASCLRKIQQLQDTLAQYPQFSKPISLAELVKFSRQAFFNGAPYYYKMPNSQEMIFLMRYMPEMNNDSIPALITSYIDKDMSRTRVSVQMKNLTAPVIDSIYEDLAPKVHSIFPSEKYDVNLTGSVLVFAQGNGYIMRNLLYSLILAFVIISFLVALSFTSVKMVLISVIPNIIPQLLTAGLMGFCGISIKTSTILVFSIALGISVDNTIHYLSRFKLQLPSNHYDVKISIKEALFEAAPSMISSALVLIAGFFIFIFSSFGGTKVVGLMVPFTLLVALLANLFVLPSIILSFESMLVSKVFGKK
jgi:Predicted exporters of the RND superfamily